MQKSYRNALHVPPIDSYLRTAFSGETSGRECAPLFYGLVQRNQSSFFQPGKLYGQISLARTSCSLKEDEVCPLTICENCENSQPRRFVNYAVKPSKAIG